MKGEQRQLCPRFHASTSRAASSADVPPPSAGYLAESPPDGTQILDELVGDQQRLAVEALDQLAQPVDFQGVDADRILGASSS